MTYRVEFLATAERQFATLPREAQKRVGRRIEALAEDPRPAASQRLRGTLKDRRRLRVGDYRVIYTVEDDVLRVLVVSVGHRRTVYDAVRRGR